MAKALYANLAYLLIAVQLCAANTHVLHHAFGNDPSQTHHACKTPAAMADGSAADCSHDHEPAPAHDCAGCSVCDATDDQLTTRLHTTRNADNPATIDSPTIPLSRKNVSQPAESRFAIPISSPEEFHTIVLPMLD